MTANQWIIVADAAHARVLQSGGANRHLEEIHNLAHPESQMYAHQLRTGGKGEVMDSAGSGQRQADPQTTQGEKHSEHFAKELSEFLQKKRDEAKFTQLVLVAEPKLLGRLREELDQRTDQLVIASIDKNWVKHSLRDIEFFLERQL